MIIRLHEGVEQDIASASDFYEEQGAGLGNYFLDSIFADIESLHLYAGIHSKHFGYHRLLAKRFPFAIYYRTDPDLVLVYAILDCRQNPAFIRHRLT
ncbi:type II toxin-antitoxin system RelE/ParE family toxin [Mariprofundus ferrooxydans]|uniref:type II toxin-antitoxin system RelE/ParE family toxin n=1 Tax=Mariprofundus ferrooxydans TaxID=314344 RepID=UPI00142F77DD